MKKKSAYNNLYLTSTDISNGVSAGTQEPEKSAMPETEPETEKLKNSKTQKPKNSKTEKLKNSKTEKPINSETQESTFRRTSYSISVNTSRSVKMLAVELDRDIQELVEEALTDLLRKHGK